MDFGARLLGFVVDLLADFFTIQTPCLYVDTAVLIFALQTIQVPHQISDLSVIPQIHLPFLILILVLPFWVRPERVASIWEKMRARVPVAVLILESYIF